MCIRDSGKGNYNNASVNDDGTVNQPVWDTTKAFNDEMHYLRDIYAPYNSIGAYPVESKISKNNPPYFSERQIGQPYRGFRTIESLESEQPVLIGARCV